jgi:AGZA family xanthine/uracil permease-like MFS transporter
MQSALQAAPDVSLNGFLLNGLLVLERGYIFTCMILAAVCALLIDRRFYAAAGWSMIAAAFAAIGLTHAYQVIGNEVDFLFVFSPPRPGALAASTFGIAVGYLLFAAVFAAFGYYASRAAQTTAPPHQ